MHLRDVNGRLAPFVDAGSLCALYAFALAFLADVGLELGDSTQNTEDQLPLARGRIDRSLLHASGGERFDAEVWEVLQLQRFSSAKVTAYAVAKRMLEEGRIGHRDVNSARQRVGAAIKRSKKLERTKLDDGKPVFPTLSVGEVLESIQVASTYEF